MPPGFSRSAPQENRKILRGKSYKTEQAAAKPRARSRARIQGKGKGREEWKPIFSPQDGCGMCPRRGVGPGGEKPGGGRRSACWRWWRSALGCTGARRRWPTGWAPAQSQPPAAGPDPAPGYRRGAHCLDQRPRGTVHRGSSGPAGTPSRRAGFCGGLSLAQGRRARRLGGDGGKGELPAAAAMGRTLGLYPVRRGHPGHQRLRAHLPGHGGGGG